MATGSDVIMFDVCYKHCHAILSFSGLPIDFKRFHNSL